MHHSGTRLAVAVRLALAFAALLVTAGCNDTQHAQLIGGGGDVELPSVPDPCATPNQGCPCQEEGQRVECANVLNQNAGYATCAQGTRICSGGVYSACVENGETRTLALGKGRRLMALGTSQACVNNACDPFCNAISDDTQGLTVPTNSDVTITDAGVTLIQTETASNNPPCTGLTISPSVATLTISQFSPPSPSTQQFTAALTPAGCYPGAPPVVWAVDRYDIATVDSSGLVTMVSPIATTINLTGYAGSLAATAQLNVRVQVLDTTQAPANTGNKFTSSSGAADTAALLYPYADTVLPLGLLPPLIQWNTGTTGAAGAVKLSVRYPATGTAIFDWGRVIPENSTLSLNPPSNSITLAGGPRNSIPAAVWTAFERTAKGQDALIVLQRLSGTTTLRSEITRRIHFANGQLKGTVYYQSYGTNLVKNFSSTYSSQTIGGGQRFGAATLAISPGATYPTVAAGYDSGSDGPGCRVCHSAAAGGSVIVSNVYATSDTMLFRLGTDAGNGGVAFPAKGDGKYAWSAVYPDGSFIFSNSGPSNNYSTATPAPGGLEDSAICKSGSTAPCNSGLVGSAPPNALYSLNPSDIGSVITSSGISSALRAAMPSFSPDGTRLVFNHYAGTVSGVTGDKRSLAMMDFNVGTKSFTNFRRLVTQSTSACSSLFGTSDPCTNVWPTVLPGNQGVVFEREIFNNSRVSGAGHADFGGTRSGCDGSGSCGDDGTKAELWWVTTANTPVQAALKRANGLNSDSSRQVPISSDVPGSSSAHSANVEPLLNYEPTMSPTAVGGYYWLAFTSRRLYGNVATVNPWWSDPRFKPIGGANGPTTKKIWISAIDQSPSSGGDPSHPAFYLPGQELLAGNSKAYWVLNRCVTASNTRTTNTECESDLDCCNAPTSAVCSLQTPIANPVKRHCIPVSSSACIADDSTTQCQTDAQCCGFSTGSRCANGVCKLPKALLLYAPGSYVRDFHSECGANQRSVWRNFQWQGKVPTGTSVDFTAATALTSAGLSSATTVFAGAAAPADATATPTWTPTPASGWAANPQDIQTNLVAQKLTSLEYLRVTMSLHPSSDQLAAPTLSNWRVTYDCLDNE